jgi:hypothetical protein
MAKRDDNAVIVFLCIVIGILFVLFAFLLLRLMTVDKALVHNKRESDKAALVLRDERERFEQLLKAVKLTEKDKE